MKSKLVPALAAAAVLATPNARADSQYKLLVLAIPNKYHYAYIPVARESLERLGEYATTFSGMRPSSYGQRYWTGTVAESTAAGLRTRSCALLPSTLPFPW